MRVSIIGGAGFIGSHIVEYHLAKGDSVHVIDDLSTGKIENLEPFSKHPHFKFDEANILTFDGLEASLLDIDRIYDLAAIVGVFRVIKEPLNVLETNIEGCERVLKAALTSAKPPRILIASSSEVYGNGISEKFKETDDVMIQSNGDTRWNYPISKIAEEALGLTYAFEKGLPITIARIFNTIGPRQTGRYGMVVPRFIEQALAGDAITVYGDGTQSRSFCDVRDTVRLFDALLSTDKSIGQIVNVGNDNEISIKGLADLICKLSKNTQAHQYIPYEQAYGQPYKDIMRRRPDLTKLMSLISYQFQWNLEKTITDLMGLSHVD